MVRQITAFFLIVCAVAGFAGPASAQIAFENAHVLTMTDGEVRSGWTVVVDEGRITAAGPAADVVVPSSATRIDASGKYLMPGLAEMHGHIPPPGEPREYIESVLFMYVANGITTVRGMLGAPGQLELREATASGAVLGPTLYLAGPSFSGGSIQSPEQADRRVREQAAEGWDYLKVHPGLTRAEYDAMARAAHEEGIPFVGHIPEDVGLVHAIEMGQESIDHLDGYIQYIQQADGSIDLERRAAAIQLTIQNDVWLVPTMALWETILGVPETAPMAAYDELRYMPPGLVAGWVQSHNQRRGAGSFDQASVDRIAEARTDLLGAMDRAGAKILMGTDAPQQFSVPGFSLRRELPLMVAAGMSPYSILKSGTQAVGEYLSAKDTFGTVTRGHRADLILLNSNPMDDVMNVFDRAGVMVRGRWLPESEIQERLARIEADYR